MYTERLNYLDKQSPFSKFVGTQALQIIENINYLLDCHAGGRGFESRPLRQSLLVSAPITWVTDYSRDIGSTLTENQSTYIPLGDVHRLANPGTIPLETIEVQSGSYLGEGDIVRFEHTYGRAHS